MSVSLQSKLGVQEGEHCSQGRISPSPIRSIEEGVNRIEQILNKKVLCRHDVQDINQAFQALDQLERQITTIPPGCNSIHALQKVIDKITELVKCLTADNLISLYHLRNFIDKEGLPIDQCFHTLKEKFNNLPDIEPKKETASNLPYCHSVAEFDRDTDVLVGPDRSREVADILDQKRAKLKNNARLNCLREKEYPSYFQELLENGYIHLFDHLIEMRDLPSLKARRDAIKKMTFSEISHVILETRNVMIQKVEKSNIPKDCQNILFLLGRSGVGNSTVYCYLRRDKMISKGSRYESRDDKSGLIGQDEKRSCTFLPAVWKTEELIIVDFPGFENSNALLIKLGLELALKALVKMYHPKILALEAITSRGGKFANAATLGRRLERLLGDSKENCVLGLTKYSEDPDVIQIKDLERQENEYLAPSREESECIGEIRTLSALQMSDLEPIIEQKKKVLEGIRQKREQQLLSLDIESQKAACRKRIEERENEFLIQIGLSKKISFDNLEDPLYLSTCFQMLSVSPSARPPRVQLPVQEEIGECLDPEDKSLLEYLLVNNLLKEIKVQEEIKLEDIKALEQNVLKFSLFEIVASLLSPEISRLIFLLQEVDPLLVRKYERKIICESINGFMKAIINTFDIVLIDKILKELKLVVGSIALIQLLEKMKFKLRDYIVGLLGITLPQDEGQANKKWDEQQKRHQQAVDQVRFLNSQRHPLAIYDAIENALTEYYKKLIQIYDYLQRLNDLRKIVKNIDDIKAALESTVSNVTSVRGLLESIEAKIERVRDAYGIEDWDKRLSSVFSEIIIKSAKIELAPYIHYILIYTYYLIEPDVQIVEYTPSSIEHFNYFIVAVGKNSLTDLKERAVESHTAHSDAQQLKKFDLKIRFKNEIISLMLEGNKQKLNIGLIIDLTSHDPIKRSLSAAALLKFLKAEDLYKNL